jgi:phosphoribosylcarboxyaminoimidazole (NCAIR) mutase
MVHIIMGSTKDHWHVNEIKKYLSATLEVKEYIASAHKDPIK